MQTLNKHNTKRIGATQQTTANTTLKKDNETINNRKITINKYNKIRDLN